MTENRYRSLPQEDVELTESVEAANCRWCRWEGWQPFRYSSSIRRCLHPDQISVHPYRGKGRDIGLCNSWNGWGECERYTPTLLTQLLRRLPDRAKPVEGDHVDCKRCRWRGPKLQLGRWCLHPALRHHSPPECRRNGIGWIMGLCHEWNRHNSCARFEPQSVTRRPAFRISGTGPPQ